MVRLDRLGACCVVCCQRQKRTLHLPQHHDATRASNRYHLYATWKRRALIVRIVSLAAPNRCCTGLNTWFKSHLCKSPPLIAASLLSIDSNLRSKYHTLRGDAVLGSQARSRTVALIHVSCTMRKSYRGLCRSYTHAYYTLLRQICAETPGFHESLYDPRYTCTVDIYIHKWRPAAPCPISRLAQSGDPPADRRSLYHGATAAHISESYEHSGIVLP